MGKSMKIVAFVLLGIGVPAVDAFAAGANAVPATFQVKANVLATCNFSSTTFGPLDFGDVDPTIVKQSSIDVSVKCNTIPTTVYVGLNNGEDPDGTQRRLKHGTSDYLSYELHKDSYTGSRWGNTGADRQTIIVDNVSGSSKTVFGTTIIPSLPIPVGSYLDTITATLALS